MTGQSVSIATALGQKESVGFLYTAGHQLLLRFGLPKHDVFIASGLIENFFPVAIFMLLNMRPPALETHILSLSNRAGIVFTLEALFSCVCMCVCVK